MLRRHGCAESARGVARGIAVTGENETGSLAEPEHLVAGLGGVREYAGENNLAPPVAVVRRADRVDGEARFRAARRQKNKGRSQMLGKVLDGQARAVRPLDLNRLAARAAAAKSPQKRISAEPKARRVVIRIRILTRTRTAGRTAESEDRWRW